MTNVWGFRINKWKLDFVEMELCQAFFMWGCCRHAVLAKFVAFSLLLSSLVNLLDSWSTCNTHCDMGACSIAVVTRRTVCTVPVSDRPCFTTVHSLWPTGFKILTTRILNRIVASSFAVSFGMHIMLPGQTSPYGIIHCTALGLYQRQGQCSFGWSFFWHDGTQAIHL